MIFFRLTIFTVLTALSYSSQAQTGAWEKIDYLPPYDDLVTVIPPESFKQVTNKGSYSNFLWEYIAENEKLGNWTKLLSISALGSAKNAPDPKSYADSLFASFKSACRDVRTEQISKNSEPVTILAHCRVKKGGKVPGSNDAEWEIGLYRFFKSNSAFYQLHFAWHGKGRAPIRSEKRKSMFIEEAQKALNEVRICDLAARRPCLGLDFDITDNAFVPLSTPVPPCATDESRQCLSQVQITFVPAAQSLGNEEKKPKFMPINIVEINIVDLNYVQNLIGILKKELKSGIPLLIISMTIKDADTLPTEIQRRQAGTLAAILRFSLIQQKVVKAEDVQIQFLNFLPAATD